MIIFCRHYKTQANVDHIVQTYTDNGILDMPKEVKEAWDENIPLQFAMDEVWVSPLKRTQQTAEALVGKWDYLSHFVTETPLRAIEGQPVILEDDDFPDDDETMQDIEYSRANVIKFWDALDKDKDIIVFSHGIVMRLLYYHVMNIPFPDNFPDSFRTYIAPISMLVFDNLDTKPTCEFIHTTKDLIQYEK